MIQMLSKMEMDTQHYFVKETKFGKKQHAADSLQYFVFQLWRCFIYWQDKFHLNCSLIVD